MRCKICNIDSIFNEDYCLECWGVISETIYENELSDNPELETEFLLYDKLLEEERELNEDPSELS